MATAPGWYEDPESEAHWRWWDGSSWGPRVEKRSATTGVPIPPPPVEEKPLNRGMRVANKWANGVLIIAAAILLWGLGILGGNSDPDPAPSATSTAPAPTPTPPEPADPEPADPEPADLEPDDPEPAAPSHASSVTVSAEGDGNSAPFELEGGDYLASVQIGGDCYYGIDLEPLADGVRSKDIGTWDEAGFGENYLYGVEGGSYYVQAITGPVPSCPWSVTLESLD